jgi:rsbT antagonist protein RsbS
MARVPMVFIGQMLVATMGDELDDKAALDLQRDVADRVVADRATAVLLDISALDIVDSFICKVLGETAAIVGILGAKVAIVGMRPAVAITLVELGLPLTGIRTALTLDQGFRLLASELADDSPAEGHDPRGGLG